MALAVLFIYQKHVSISTMARTEELTALMFGDYTCLRVSYHSNTKNTLTFKYLNPISKNILRWASLKKYRHQMGFT